MFSAALLVEDDAAVATLIQEGLAREGTSVRCAETVEAAQAALLQGAPDLFLIDLVLPDGSGLTFLDDVRDLHPTVPVVVITGLDAPGQVVEGLDRGADLYLTKPFTPSELAAHLRALHRRTASGPPAVLELGGIELDQVARVVRYRGASVKLTDVEARLFSALLSREGEVASRQEIFAQVWKLTFDPGTGLLHSHIRNLRNKLDTVGLGSAVASVRGQGYRVVPPQAPPAHP